MNDNPYQTPVANLETPDNRPGRPVLAVIVSVITDFLVTMIGGAGIAILTGIYLAANGYSQEAVGAIFVDQSATNPYFWVVTIWSLLSSVLAGYVCAVLARRNLVKPVIWAIVILTLLSIPLLFMLDNKLLHIALGLVSIAAFASGAWLFAVRKQRAARKLEEAIEPA